MIDLMTVEEVAAKNDIKLNTLQAKIWRWQKSGKFKDGDIVKVAGVYLISKAGAERLLQDKRYAFNRERI